MTSMERFTQRAQRVVSLAQEEARRFQQNDVGTEHLLLGMLREEGSIACHVLRGLGVEVVRVEALVRQLVTVSKRGAVEQPPMTREARQVLKHAQDEAKKMGIHFVGTEHLLLGLVRLKQGTAIDILTRLEITADQVRGEVERILDEPVTPDMPSES